MTHHREPNPDRAQREATAAAARLASARATRALLGALGGRKPGALARLWQRLTGPAGAAILG